MSAQPIRIAISSGDPSGIGPEVVLKALRIVEAASVQWCVIGDLEVYKNTAQSCRFDLPDWTVSSIEDTDSDPVSDSKICFIDCGHVEDYVPREVSAEAGRASLDYIDTAIRLYKKGSIQGLVTAPVTKYAIEQSGSAFSGHTEYLQEALGVDFVVMFFIAEALRVAIATRHVPLAQVSAKLDQTLLEKTIRLTYQGLQTQFGVVKPKLALCGLNPHAGEGGLFGEEEQRVFYPVFKRLQIEGIHCAGPFAADGFFAGTYKNYDAVICGYHDQGLIPFKMVARDAGCQVTLGLPLVRTSPDHGSALDIAGKNQAHPGAMAYAMQMAVQLLKSER